MNTSKPGLKLVMAFMTAVVMAVVISCSEDDKIAFTDKQSVSSEASTDSYYEDAEDISFTVSAATNADIGGRSASVGDDRLACATLSLSAGATTEAGTITIDFGAGCAFAGITRKGKILITYSGPRLTVGSSITITFDAYTVNGVKIEGTRTVKITGLTNSSITHEITLTNGKITWPDNSTATRNAHHFRTWDWKGNLVRLDDEVSLLAGGSAEGTNRNGKSYTMEITEDIVFKAECRAIGKFMPSSGEKILAVDNKTITVNYGSGDCDNLMTVSINGGQGVEVTVIRE